MERPFYTDWSFHARWSRFSLQIPFHDRTRPVEDQPPTADVRQHTAFGFLANPLKARSAFFVPNNLPQPFRRNQLIQFCQRGSASRSRGKRRPPGDISRIRFFSRCGMMDCGFGLHAAAFLENVVLILHRAFPVWLSCLADIAGGSNSGASRPSGRGDNGALLGRSPATRQGRSKLLLR